MKMKWIASVIPVFFVHLFPNLSAAGLEASELLRYKDANTGLTILRAKVSLPAPGYWTPVPAEAAAAAGLREVFLNVANEDDHALLTGRRMSRRAELKEIASAQWPLNHLSCKAVTCGTIRADQDRIPPAFWCGGRFCR